MLRAYPTETREMAFDALALFFDPAHHRRGIIAAIMVDSGHAVVV